MTQTAEMSPAPAGPTMLCVDVLGTTVVRVDGRTVDLGRRQVRQLVAALVLRSNTTVSADALIDHLWPDDLPQHPRKALNVALSRLRSALGAASARLEVVGDGYRLAVDELDIDRFVELFEHAREATGSVASALLGEALESWTGQPFADFPDAPLFEGRRSSLEELRWFGVTRQTELLVESGDHERAVALSGSLIEETVIRERLVIAHARALARSGRKADALAVTGRAIKRLRTEHGLEPSEALREAERAILSGAVDLDLTSATHARPVGDVFVGRSGELATLCAIDPGQTIAVVAEAGMGKSALLSRFVDRCGAAGRKAIKLDVSPTPDRPLDAIARLCMRIAGDRAIEAKYRGALARVCPELDMSSPIALTRDAMVDDLARFIEGRASETVLVLDDAHWLDNGSTEVVARLIARRRVALIVSMRPSDAAANGLLEGFPLVTLAPLATTDVAAIAREVSGRSVDAGILDRLVQRSGGNALFVRLLIERWMDGGAPADDLPTSVLVAVREMLDLLGRPVLDTLDVAAVIGSTFSIHTLRQLRPNADVHLDAAAAAGLLGVDRRIDTATFTHALVADVCHQLLATGRRVSIHDQVGRTLEIDGAAAAAFAHHYVAAASLDPERAVWASLRAAGEFIAGFDWTTALEHIEHAVAVAEEYSFTDPTVLAQIAVRRGTIGRALDLPTYVDDLLVACDHARAAGSAEVFVVAVTELCGLGRTSVAGTTDERVIALLDEALGLEIRPSLRAELCAAAVPLFSTSEHSDRGRRLFHEAWSSATRLGDPDVEAAVVLHAHLGFAHPDDFDLLVAAAERMSQLAGSDAELIWEAAFVRFQCAIVLGHPAAAHDAIDQMRLYESLVTRRPRNFGLAFSESAYAALTGDADAAERHADEALRIGLERYDQSWATTIYGLLLLTVRADQGRLAELAPLVAELVGSAPTYAPYRAVAAFVAIDAGDATAARAHCDVIAADGFAGIVRDVHFTAVLTLVASAIAEVGTPDEVGALWELLAPFGGRMSWNGASSNGPVDAALAMLARSRGACGEADRLQAAADVLVSSFRLPSDVARSVPVRAASS